MTAPRMSVLDPAGPQAAEIKWLWDIFLGVSIVVWVLVVGFLVTAAIVARRARKRDPEGPLTKSLATDKRRAQVVLVAGLATVATLLVLLVLSIHSGDTLAALEDDPEAVHVRIVAHQWWWEIEYEHDEPTRSAGTANELHVPVGKLVHLELLSGDVIHSFWVPSVHGKRDLIPGRTNRTWIRIDEPGVYRGQCAEFCGLEHAKMSLTVIAESPEQFDAWLKHQREPAQVPSPTDAVRSRGMQVFNGGPCVLCHTIAGTTAGGRLGPDLTHFASRATIGAGTVPNTVGHLTGWVIDAPSIKPGVHMPSIQLPADDLHALVAYLGGLQ
ncbi:MAG TPA: cytochrome c oxidase subunit II [Kofleriaceae bacterium]|nr:cytochrome c oxidase subunit II [Kofleriaceae bacterium]